MAGAFARRFSPAPAAHNASSSIPSCAGPPVPTRASASGSPCVWIVPRGRFPFLPTSPQLCAVPRKQSELSPASRPLYAANFSAGCSPRARPKRAHDASRAASRTSSPAPAANRAGASHARLGVTMRRARQTRVELDSRTGGGAGRVLQCGGRSVTSSGCSRRNVWAMWQFQHTGR